MRGVEGRWEEGRGVVERGGGRSIGRKGEVGVGEGRSEWRGHLLHSEYRTHRHLCHTLPDSQLVTSVHFCHPPLVR